MKSIFLLFLLLGVAAAGRDAINVVKSYEEFESHGLKGKVTYYEDRVIALGVQYADAKKTLPDWMQALYITNRNGEARERLYQFDTANPNRVSASFGWDKSRNDWIVIVGPVIRDSETFQGKQYLAILASDLIKWKGRQKEEAGAAKSK